MTSSPASIGCAVSPNRAVHLRTVQLHDQHLCIFAREIFIQQLGQIITGDLAGGMVRGFFFFSFHSQPPLMRANSGNIAGLQHRFSTGKTQASLAVRYASFPASTAPATVALTSSTDACARRVQRFPVEATSSTPFFTVLEI